MLQIPVLLAAVQGLIPDCTEGVAPTSTSCVLQATCAHMHALRSVLYVHAALENAGCARGSVAAAACIFDEHFATTAAETPRASLIKTSSTSSPTPQWEATEAAAWQKTAWLGGSAPSSSSSEVEAVPASDGKSREASPHVRRGASDGLSI
mmetsp:Transcript_15752/g.35339  ORF Transcript_15752/g.35339 Transcript_15752/m.35339 type:complete len:151 (+) Transcript_15752:164-616(+)